MIFTQNEVDCACLPDCAYCSIDDEKRNPLDIEECPIGCLECNGDCEYYGEDWE